MILLWSSNVLKSQDRLYGIHTHLKWGDAHHYNHVIGYQDLSTNEWRDCDSITDYITFQADVSLAYDSCNSRMYIVNTFDTVFEYHIFDLVTNKIVGHYESSASTFWGSNIILDCLTDQMMFSQFDRVDSLRYIHSHKLSSQSWEIVGNERNIMEPYYGGGGASAVAFNVLQNKFVHVPRKQDSLVVRDLSTGEESAFYTPFHDQINWLTKPGFHPAPNLVLGSKVYGFDTFKDRTDSVLLMSFDIDSSRFDSIATVSNYTMSDRRFDKYLLYNGSFYRIAQQTSYGNINGESWYEEHYHGFDLKTGLPSDTIITPKSLLDYKIVSGLSLSANSKSPDVSVEVSPNPCSGFIRVKCDLECELLFEVYSVQGVLVLKDVLKKGSAEVSVLSLCPGSYFYRFTNGQKLIKTGKIVKN